MPINTITSDYILSDIDNHFKVSAGPGAGKTHWLVNHIKHVLHNSDKLLRTRKIACITYTNIAVETILKRLGTSAERVEVSTIHSFFYNNVVKPYVSFIADEYQLDVSKIDGHDDITQNWMYINEWITNHPNSNLLKHPYSVNQLTKLPNYKYALINWLNSLVYKIDVKTEEVSIISDRSDAFYLEGTSRRYLNKKCLDALEIDFLEYKKKYWQNGKISHDDILFFSFQIIIRFPFVLDILSSKFPYIFVDEFQDSNPIQVEIIKKIASKKTITGVIGDVAQSIYEFQGADCTQFELFTLPNIENYILEENRRSSNEIIDVLNFIRTDISQIKFRNFTNVKPSIFIGDMDKALRIAKDVCVGEKVYTLSRNNITSNAMKAEINGTGLDNTLLDKLKEVDSNNRSKLIYSCIRAIAYARENKFKDAIKELEKYFNYKTDKIRGKKKALKYITIFLENFSEFENSSLLEFSEFIRNNIDSEMTKVTRGAVKLFYEINTFNKLYLCVSIPEDLSLHKTIHKAKGDEFDNVLLVLKQESDLDFLLNKNISNNEEHRINYVGCSRAKNRLFISVPLLSEEKKEILRPLFEIHNI